jgi:hypothetical protein
LEDIHDAKETAGINRLEWAVQQGYLKQTVQREETAFALMYYEACAPLIQLAKTVTSPLEMNPFHLSAIQNWIHGAETPLN